MFFLSCSLFLFLGVHSLRVFAPGWRSRVQQKYGEAVWKGVYSLTSLLSFALLCWSYGQERQQAILLWSPPHGMRHLTVLLMLVSWILLLAAYVPGNAIKARVHHPMLLAVIVWALAHLVANGSATQVLLFGSFLLWAVACFISARQRDRAAKTIYPKGRIFPTVVTVVLGIVVWVGFAFYLHRLLIGVPIFG
jgi:uncharacterized membrane protein